MITRKEYNKALCIVEEFHEQLNAEINNSKTPIEKWDKLNKCSVRLYNVLNGYSRYALKEYVQFIEDINENNFSKTRNAGKKTWKEFIELRGY